ncbi:MAG: TerY-C metal binding domain-containing protein [Planctomycetia bacterium]|nr:TerY-C metal binding domain-containing protein [Planctomycetia bacterium]
MRRLPIYFVLDCSESMVGEAFDGMKKGLKSLLAELTRDPAAMELAYLSVISFASSAKQVVPLTELCQFRVPELTLGSGTALGAALQLLENKVNQEVVRSTMTQKGDYKPIVFLMTDGEPTDSWLPVAGRLMHNHHIQTVAVGVGPDVNLQSLMRISENVIHARVPEEENFSRFFKFVSSSVSTASQQIDSGNEGKIDLRKLPESDSIVIVDNTTPIPEVIPGRLLFLHLKCSSSDKYVLIKYEKREQSGFFSSKTYYELVGSFPVDDFDFSGNDKKLTISTEQLQGDFICPYCGNESWARCSCGSIFCCCEIINNQAWLECPWCNQTGYYAPSSFNLGGGAG